MKAAIYARVSTGKQEQSLEEQIRLLDEFCAGNKYEIYKTYSEIVSGTKADREQLRELMDDAAEGKFNVVVVLKLDRFGRSMLNLLSNVELLQLRGIDFISVQDHIETNTPQGKLIFHIMGALAEFERSLIYERTKVGIERAKREGKTCHRPKKPINWDRVKLRYDKGLSMTEIAALEKVALGTLHKRMNAEGIVLKKTLEDVK